MRVIFVGSGSIGRRHLRNWQMLMPESSCCFVARERPENLESTVAYFETLKDALTESADCVFLSNPSVYHLKSASFALRKGCHVFCEKPLSHSSEGVRDLIALAGKCEKVLFVGYNLRFHACLMEMRRRLKDAEIGKLLTLFLEVGQALPDWRPHLDYRKSVSARKELGGGALLELSHEIDAALWFSDLPLHRGFAKAGKTGELDLEVEDYASLALDFDGLGSAMIHVDFIQRPGGRRYRLIGTKGALSWDSAQNTVQKTTFDSGEVEEIELPSANDPNHSYMAQMAKFIELVQMDRCDTSYAEGGAKVLECLHTLDYSINHE